MFGISIEYLIFIFFSGAVIVATLGTIVSSSPVASALFLVVDFLCLAGIYVLLNAPFIAMVQVMIYAGAIMVIFLFAIMLLNLKSLPKIKFGWKHATGTIIAILFMAQVAFTIKGSLKNLPQFSEKTDVSVISVLSQKLFSGSFLLPFEVSSVLLLVAIVGAILITKRTT